MATSPASSRLGTVSRTNRKALRPKLEGVFRRWLRGQEYTYSEHAYASRNESQKRAMVHLRGSDDCFAHIGRQGHTMVLPRDFKLALEIHG